MKSYKYGSFQLSEANGIAVAEADELSGAKRQIALASKAGGRGVSVLRVQEQEKVVEITGKLFADDKEALITVIRNLEKNLMAAATDGKANLQITNEKGTWIYDNAVLMNVDTLADKEKHYNVRWIPFRAMFLCPKGFVRSNTLTTETVTDITTTPYNGSVTITGNTSPQNILKFTFDTASTITQITFTNTTVNESITIPDLTLADGDILEIDTNIGEVRLNNQKIRFNGVFPSFLPDLNNYQIAVAGSSNISESQETYNAEYALYGNRKISQKFTVNGTGARTSLAFLLKKVVTLVEELYDGFSSGSDWSGSLWDKSNPEPGDGICSTGIHNGKGRWSCVDNISNPTSGVSGGSGPNQDILFEQNSDLANAGDGAEVSISIAQANGSSFAYFRFTDGTDYIQFRVDGQAQNFKISSSSHYGSLSNVDTGLQGGVFRIEQVGSDIEIRANGSLIYTIENVTTKVNSYIEFRGNGLSTTPYTVDVDYATLIRDTNANGDITARIETDSSGEPSGTLADVPDSTLTIPASVIGTEEFLEILTAFATNPSLTDTDTLHIVLSQAGGDIDNYILIKKNTAGGYAGGNILTSTDGGTTWTNVSAEDLWFKVYSSVPASFNIDHENRYYPSYISAG